MKRFALTLVIALISIAAHAQTLGTWNIQLTVPAIGGRTCGQISQEVITDPNGNNVPYDINAVAGGLSDDVCNNYMPNYPYSYPTIPLFINLPPQPSDFIVQPEWVQILPPASQIVRGQLPVATATSPENVQTVDGFNYIFTYSYYILKQVAFVGTNTRQWTKKESCYRGRCFWYYSEVSAFVNMNGTVLN